MDTKDHAVDINMTTDVLMPETDVKGGLSLPNEEQLLFRIPKNKSVLASELTNESRTEISVESTGREASTIGSSSIFRTHGHHERVDERRVHRRQRANNRSFTSEKKHRRHEHPPRTPVAPSPEPIRSYGAASKRASGSRQVGKSHQPSFSVASNSEVNDNERGSLAADQSYEITDEMLHEMDYNADREWYDREEHNTMFDSYNSSLFQGDDTFQKKEAELAKRLTRKDGSLMTFAQSKKMPQLTADNAQWEDRRLLRSGSVRGAEVQMEFEDEDERKVILVFHDTKPPFLDGMVNTKQAEPVMLVKDPTSHMAIIARKGSSLVRHIHEKQFMDKFRQEFWEEFAESKLGQNWVDADGNAA